MDRDLLLKKNQRLPVPSYYDMHPWSWHLSRVPFTSPVEHANPLAAFPFPSMLQEEAKLPGLNLQQQQPTRKIHNNTASG